DADERDAGVLRHAATAAESLCSPNASPGLLDGIEPDRPDAFVAHDREARIAAGRGPFGEALVDPAVARHREPGEEDDDPGRVGDGIEVAADRCLLKRIAAG